jgi:uncharacterized membrane protein YuzA (DUF378 family)
MSAILHSEASGQPSLVRIVGHAFYNTAANITGIVGLTPLQVGYILIGILVVSVLSQLFMAATDRKRWTLDDE